MSINSLNSYNLFSDTGFNPWRFLAGLKVATPADISPGQQNTPVQPAAAAAPAVTPPTTATPQAVSTAAVAPAASGDTSSTATGVPIPQPNTTAAAGGTGTQPAAATPASQQLAYSDWQQSNRLEMTIHTREGDTVTLSIQRDRSVTDALYLQNATDQQTVGLSHSTQSSLSIGYTVNGNLSQDELNAIDNLVNQVGKLADKFFSGNVPATLNKIKALGFDTQTLTDFALQMNTSETKTAVQAYTSTGQLGADGSGTTAPAGDVANLAGFTQGLKQLLSDKQLNTKFDTGNVVKDVFRQVGDHHGPSHHRGHHHSHDFMSALSDIMDQLTQLAQNDPGTAAAAPVQPEQSAQPPVQPASGQAA